MAKEDVDPVEEYIRKATIGEIEQPEIVVADYDTTWRGRLREDAADRELYARTKKELASGDWATMQHCAETKTEVVEGIIARAIAARDSGES